MTLRTCDVEIDFESVLAGAVARDAGVVSAVGPSSGVEDERADAVFVDDDLVQPVVENFGAVAEPVQVGVRSASHDAVEACHVSFRNLDVRRDLAERRAEVGLRDAAQLAVAPVCRTANERNGDVTEIAALARWVISPPQRGEFRFLEVLSPNPHNIHARFHRHRPCGLGALGFENVDAPRTDGHLNGFTSHLGRGPVKGVPDLLPTSIGHYQRYDTIQLEQASRNDKIKYFLTN